MQGETSAYHGEERRSRQMSEGEIKVIAQTAAEMAIANLFEIFGVDVTTKEGRRSLQDDFHFLRDARMGTAGLKRAGWVAAMGTIVTAICLALWKGMVVLAAAAAK